MPTADKFSTNGVYNGLSGCVPKVDVSNFDHWTTASGYNKDSEGAVTQEQIDHSLQKIGRLYWNLYRLELNTYGELFDGQDFVLESLTELIIKGDEDDAIQPKDRVCEGSISEDGVAGKISAVAKLLLDPIDAGFVRMYKGDRDDEENFIGYGLGEVNRFAGSPLETYIAEVGVAEAFVGLGGFKRNETDSARTHHYSYVTINGIDMVFYGFVKNLNAGETPQFINNPPTSAYEGFGFQAEITSLEMWEY